MVPSYRRVGFQDAADGTRTVSIPCTDGDIHQVTVNGSNVTLLHQHDPELLAVAAAFGGKPPPCHRIKMHSSVSWGNPPAGQKISKADGWRRKMVIIAAFVAAAFDLELPDHVDLNVAIGGWNPLAKALFWSNVPDDDIPWWVSAGIVEMNVVRSWSRRMDARTAGVWMDAGVTNPDIAIGWLDSGVTDPEDAVAATSVVIGMWDSRVAAGSEPWWAIAGVTRAEDIDAWWDQGLRHPPTVAAWAAARYTPAEAAAWTANGFDNPGQANAWRDDGWSPVEAVAAVEKGANGPRHARQLTARGVLPTTALPASAPRVG